MRRVRHFGIISRDRQSPLHEKYNRIRRQHAEYRDSLFHHIDGIYQLFGHKISISQTGANIHVKYSVIYLEDQSAMYLLINTPFIKAPAGVSNHYLGLKNYFSDKVIYNQCYTRLYIQTIIISKMLQKVVFPALFLFNYIKFMILLCRLRKPTVLLNPSFARDALKRDEAYLKIAKLLGCKVAVFIHGWDKIYLDSVFKDTESFSKTWHKADAFFVLAEEFKAYLSKLGIKAPVHLTTTKVNDQLVEGVKFKQIKALKNILFLARIEKAKGIFTTIDTFEILCKTHPDLSLTVVGSGNALETAKNYAKSRKLTNISFTGPLHGENLKKEFLKADLYILPTTHGEGMPTSVLEAMAFGLPVITRPVGGLVDFFENDKMGYLIESLNPLDYAQKIDLLINDIEKANAIANYNMEYAHEYFLASKVARQLEKILSKI